MRFMRLAPETVRLRRIARAWAAGECSLQDYREARRSVIDNFAPPALDDEDTRRRGPERTQRPATATGRHRRSAPWADAARLPGGELAAQGGLEEASSQGSGRWLLVLAGLLALVAVLALWPAVTAAAESVPAVSERDPDPAGSPRLPVREVRLQPGSLEAFAGVDHAAVDQVIEATLDAIRARNVEGPHGFTAAELEEVGRYLSVLGVHQGDALDAADARDLSALIRDQKRRRGVSVLELEEVARAVQAHLREAGYFLAVVYVPSQSVRNGVVELEALPGRLGEVVVDGERPGAVQRHFADLVGEPLTLPLLTQRLHQLSEAPGLQAQASLEPGAQVGETRLRLNVVEQRQWLASLRLDNHGDGATGAERLLVDGSWLDPRGVGDRVDVGVLATLNPGNQAYGFLAYEAPVAAWRLRGQIGRNDFTWDRGADRDGAGTYLDLGARRLLAAGAGRELEIRLGVARHELDWDDAVDQSVSQFSVGLWGERIDREARLAAEGMLSFTAGHVGEARFAGQDSDFWALQADLLVWTPLDLPLMSGEQKLALRLQGQLTDSYLPATQRFALSGPYRSRAFDRGDLLVDQGVVLGVDLRMPIGIGEMVLFADTAYGEDNNGLTPAWRHATDVGVAWDADLTRRLTSRLSLALPLTTKGTGGIDDDGSRFYWSLRYAH